MNGTGLRRALVPGCLLILSLTIGVCGVAALGQDRRPAGEPGPGVSSDVSSSATMLMVGSVVTTIGVIIRGWMEMDRSSLTRRLEKAERDAAGCAEDLKRVRGESDLWMRQCYRMGYSGPEPPQPPGPDLPRLEAHS